MEKIIDPIDVALLEAELTHERKLCDTNKGGNEVYLVDAFSAPNVLMEIGRLREEAFREAGGSSGKSMDLDEFDTRENPYQQIVIWDPDAKAILGGYRFMMGNKATFLEDGQPDIYNAHMFHFSDEFIQDYLPHTLELGRSFVSLAYQSSKAGAKAIYSLDNLWDGIAAVMISHPKLIYFFGNMTMYKSYDHAARDLILRFLIKHFGDRDNLVTPLNPVDYYSDKRLLDVILSEQEFKQDYRILKSVIRTFGYSIPPLVNSYMNISPTMLCFGTGVDNSLGGSEGTAILVNYTEMYADKRDRHKIPYLKHLVKKLMQRFPDIKEDAIERVEALKDLKKANVFKKFLKRKKKDTEKEKVEP